MSKIVILGAGESGAGAAVLAKKEGFEVFVSDMSKIKDNYKKLMDDHNIEWEEGHHTEEKILDADEVIKSPGIPKEAPMIQKLMAKGTPIISEIEFAGRYTDAKMICITGSNGKTTTTSLIYHIIKSALPIPGRLPRNPSCCECRVQGCRVRQSCRATSGCRLRDIRYQHISPLPGP
jgi:UDP-N-acetylmuramoylalanine--D-glutamate ligase